MWPPRYPVRLRRGLKRRPPVVPRYRDPSPTSRQGGGRIETTRIWLDEDALCGLKVPKPKEGQTGSQRRGLKLGDVGAIVFPADSNAWVGRIETTSAPLWPGHPRRCGVLPWGGLKCSRTSSTLSTGTVSLIVKGDADSNMRRSSLGSVSMGSPWPFGGTRIETPRRPPRRFRKAVSLTIWGDTD